MSRLRFARKPRCLLALLAGASLGVGVGCDAPGLGGSEAGDEPSTLAAEGAELASTLNVDQLIGQRILVSFDGTRLPEAVAERLRSGLSPGVVLFDRNYSSEAQLRRLTAEIQRAAAAGPVEAPALVMADQEGGAVRRFPGPPELSAEAMGDELTTAEISEQGRLTGEFLGKLGVNVDLAPVADLGVEGGALAGEGRTFAADPIAVSGAAEAFADGLHSEGVAATAKHFPGFGSADVNTDLGPAVVERSPGEAQRDLAPFGRLIDGGVPLVMLSTAVYPEYAQAPAGLAPKVAQGLLRGDLGFAGVTVTDALDTPALEAHAPPADVAVGALGAATDLLLYAHSTRASLDAHAAAVDAVRQEVLNDAELRASAARVLALRLGLADQDALARLTAENGE